MSRDREDSAGPSLSPAAGVGVVMVVLALVLGAGYGLTRQAVQRPTSGPAPAAVSTEQLPPGTEPRPVRATATAVPSGPVTTGAGTEPRRTDTPAAIGGKDSRLAVVPTPPADTNPRTGAQPRTSAPRPVAGQTEGPARSGPRVEQAGPPSDDAQQVAPVFGEPPERLVQSAPLPVELPSSAVLDGAEVLVGPDGVRTAGARAFARTLLQRAQARVVHPNEEPALQQVAEEVLADELARAQIAGLLRPTRLRQGDVTVQVDLVATLPNTRTATMPLPSGGRVTSVGIAAGVAQRTDPDYLPDLVAVAAVAYR